MASKPYSFVVAANDRDTLSKNLLTSPCLANGTPHELLIFENYSSAASAYNCGLKKCRNEIVVFVHQDVYLPEEWLVSLEMALQAIEGRDPNWGVAGCWGVRGDGAKFGYLYTPGEGIIGDRMLRPEPVRTLDEVVLIVRKASGLKYDEDLHGFHFYGADICLAAAQSGRNCYALSAFCIHNSRQYFEYPADFYDSYRYIKHKWKHWLPIQTSCICVSRFDWDLKKRAVKRAIFKLTGRSFERGPRLEDPRSAICQSVHQDLRLNAWR
jgi:glycosyltransferase involved in cell wall biosynthesis